jgi:hypothetical protein
VGEALIEALIGGPIDEEAQALLGRFGWLKAFKTDWDDLLNNPEFSKLARGDDPDATWEASEAIDRLIKAVEPILRQAIRSAVEPTGRDG